MSCDDDSTITGGVIEHEPELVGCEAASTYDWDSGEFDTSLDGGADTWIGFSLEELTYFSVFVSQAGFLVSVFEECDGEIGAGAPLFEFQTIGNGIDIGIVPSGEYWINILNTRPNRADFTFRLDLSTYNLFSWKTDLFSGSHWSPYLELWSPYQTNRSPYLALIRASAFTWRIEPAETQLAQKRRRNIFSNDLHYLQNIKISYFYIKLLTFEQTSTLCTQSSPLPEQLGIIEMLTKLQILKWLSNPNGSWQLLETQDSDR